MSIEYTNARITAVSQAIDLAKYKGVVPDVDQIVKDASTISSFIIDNEVPEDK